MSLAEEENRQLEVVTLTNTYEKKLGEKMSMYCSTCEEERIFVWTKWRGVEFFGYPPEQEYGWECTACGSKFSVSEPDDRQI